MKKPVKRRALVERIRRKLGKEGKAFYKNRAGPYTERMGDYYVVDLNRNSIVCDVHDLEKFAHDEGFLKPWEGLEGEEG